jgi:hypothetical protein
MISYAVPAALGMGDLLPGLLAVERIIYPSPVPLFELSADFSLKETDDNAPALAQRLR